MTKKQEPEMTIKQLKDQLDQLISEINSAEPDEIESSKLKLKEAKEIISRIEKRLKFSEVEVSEL